jgi:hypothetical protein
MKRLTFSIWMLCLAAISFGQNQTDTYQSQIRELILESFDEVWGQLNAGNIHKYYTKDFLLLENGVVWNNDSIANYLNKAKLRNPVPNRVNSIDVIEIKIFDDRAWIAYRNGAVFMIENQVVRKAEWLESATAVLTENGWRLEMLHATVVKKE